MAKLEKCPFCGASPELKKNNFNGRYWVRCPRSTCVRKPQTGQYNYKSGATNAWNARAAKIKKS